MKKLPVYLLFLAFLSACAPATKTVEANAIEFTAPARVEVKGYNGNIMEPFVSRDGNTLLFNNLNSQPENTNLHWAVKINDSAFEYKGELTGINTNHLEGVATLNNAGDLYFVSDRNYTNTLSTLYQGNFYNGRVTDIQVINGVSKLQAGWVNFDVEVSANGQSLYFVDAQFDQTGNPASADLVVASKDGAGFVRAAGSNAILKNINTDALEYAACISVDELELYFTRIQLPFTAAAVPEILFSNRQSTTEAFSKPHKIKNITGFAEAPTILPDQKRIIYHKKENNKFVLYMITKK